jgi:hypothetical protein
MNVRKWLVNRRSFLCGVLTFVLCPKIKGNSEDQFKEICLYVDKPNTNKRIYPRAIVKKEIERFKEIINNRAMIGELGMPRDSIIHLSNASHIVADLSLIGDAVEATIEVLDTPQGKVLQRMLKDKAVCFRTRGVGNCTVDANGNFVIGDSYKLVSVDALPKNEAAIWE